jgi:dTDP-L-rhamnose 4-epimerase
VVVVDDLDPAAHDGLPAGLHDGVTYRWADLREPHRWNDLLRNTDAVSHQAAKVGLGVDFADVEEYVGRNDAATATLLRALHHAGFAGRIVLASSMVVYGEGRYRCATHGVVRPGPRAPDDLAGGRFDPACPRCGRQLTPQPVPEHAPADPRNVYAATKLAQEHLCAAFAREHPGVTTIALRYHNVYGPLMPRDTPYAGVASIFRSAYARGDVPAVFEDGGQLRDFVHVDDVARANLLALHAPTDVHGPFNVCSGEPHTILELADAIRGPGAPHPRVTGRFRLGDIRHVFASAERSAAVLGFEASVPFAAGMARFAQSELRTTVAPRPGELGTPSR